MTLILFFLITAAAAVSMYFLLKPPVFVQSEAEHMEAADPAVIVVEPVLPNAAAHVSPLIMNRTVGK